MRQRGWPRITAKCLKEIINGIWEIISVDLVRVNCLPGILIFLTIIWFKIPEIFDVKLRGFDSQFSYCKDNCQQALAGMIPIRHYLWNFNHRATQLCLRLKILYLLNSRVKILNPRPKISRCQQQSKILNWIQKILKALEGNAWILPYCPRKLRTLWRNFKHYS